MARKSGGIRTQIAVNQDELSPQAANKNVVEVARQTAGDEMSTTERLFGDVLAEGALTDENTPAPGQSIPLSQNPLTEEAALAPVEKKEEQQVEAPEPQQPKQEEVSTPNNKEEEFLDLDKFANRRVKTKIDGREEFVPFKEVVGQYQLKKHLNEAADRVGEERRKLAEEKRQLMELRQMNEQRVQQIQPDLGQSANVERQAQFAPQSLPLDPLIAKIQYLEAQMNQMAEGTKPVIYQSNRQRVADDLKRQGFNDFMDYIPKMEGHMVSLRDPSLVNFYDTPEGAKALYFQLKAQDLQGSLQRQAPAPVAQPSPAVRPPITKIDGGGQPSSGNVDDAGFRYKQDFRKAVNLGDDKEAWNNVLRNKGIIE
jgi:hypothetical protein